MPALQTINAAPGQQVEFIPIVGSEYTAFLWDFGDGQTSTQRQPLHTYQSTGSFAVRLTATAVSGKQAVANKPAFSFVSTSAGATFADGLAWSDGLLWSN